MVKCISIIRDIANYGSALTVEQEQLVRIFKALANTNRLRILEAIKNYQVEYSCCPGGCEPLETEGGGTCCVDKIGGQFDMAQSTISQHLKELYNAGLLERHKKAQWVYYTINPEVLGELSEYLSRFVSDLAKGQ
jgi:ArsR family transcriptional regulator